MIPLTSPFGIRWHWWQWHCMIKIILHLILIVLTGEMQWCHWWCYQHHLMLRLALMVLHDQENYFNYLDPRNAMVPLTMLLELCDVGDMVSQDQNRHVAYNFNCLYIRNIMMPITMLFASCDTDTDPMASCDTNTSDGICYQNQWQIVIWTKSHVTSNFDCHNLRNVMGTLRMLTVKCDANISARGMTWPESHVASHIYHIIRNAMMPLASVTLTLAPNGITWPKNSFCILITLSGHKECYGAIEISINLYQWCHRNKKSCCT